VSILDFELGCVTTDAHHLTFVAQGSRVHAYKFVYDKVKGLVLQNELFKQLKPGLSSYKDDPEAGAGSLVPLLDAALDTIPKEEQQNTPANVKATAGLRLLGPQEADDILDKSRQLLKRYPFLYDPEDGVEIMDGLSEAFFAWVTINYLTDKLHEQDVKTAVMLDLGGGSTQIAMAIPTGKGNVGQVQVTRKDILGQRRDMFLKSFLGYGLMAGRDGILGVGVTETAKREGLSEVTCGCVPPGTKVTFEYGSNKWRTDDSSASYEHCYDTAKKYIFSPEGDFSQGKNPAPARDQPVFAMSYYFDRAQDVGLIPPHVKEAQLTPMHYKQAAEQTCGKDTATLKQTYPQVEDEKLDFLCMDLCFITALLLDGFKLSPSATVNLAKQITYNGAAVETQWTLGAAIEEISEHTLNA
jgi:hypothetical protein